MAEGDSDLIINIRTLADQYGLREVTRTISELKRETKGVGEAAGEHVKHSRELHRLIHQLDHIVPGLGLAMKAAFDPRNMGLAATILIVHEVVKLIGELKKHFDEIAKKQSEIDVHVWEEMAKQAREAADQSFKIAEQLAKLPAASEKFEKHEERILQLLKNQYELKKKLAGEDKARVEELDYEEGRAVIRQLQGEGSRARGQMGLAQKRLKGAEAARDEGPYGKEGAVEAADWLKEHKDDVLNATTRLRSAKSKFGDQTPEEYESTAHLQAQSGHGDIAGPMFYALQEFKDAAKVLEKSKLAQSEREVVVASYTRAQESLKNKTTEAAAEVEKFKKIIEKLDDQLQKEQDAFGSKNKTAAALDLQKAGLKPESVIGNTLVRDIQIIEQAQRRAAEVTPEQAGKMGQRRMASFRAGTVDPEDQVVLWQLRQSLVGRGKTDRQIQELFKILASTDKDMTAKLAALLQALGQDKAQKKTAFY